MYIMRSESNLSLREELAKSPQKILASAFPDFFDKPKESLASVSLTPPVAQVIDDILVNQLPESLSCQSGTNLATGSDAHFQGLAQISTLVKLMSEWLQSNRVVFDTLVLVWKSPTRITRLQNEQELSLIQLQQPGKARSESSVYDRHIKKPILAAAHSPGDSILRSYSTS